MGTTSLSPLQRSTWYRARRPLPAVAVITMLAAIAGLVWVSVLNRPGPALGCQSADAATARSLVAPYPGGLGQRLPPDGLDAITPAPPQLAIVQVLNANGRDGMAGVVATELATLGFAPTTKPSNDPLHPTFDLFCYGEIRFGAMGEAAARTLSLVVPCAELVRDLRPGKVIDLALGTEFTKLEPNDAARKSLQRLIYLGQPASDDLSSGDQTAGLMAPGVDPDLLRQARAVAC